MEDEEKEISDDDGFGNLEEEEEEEEEDKCCDLSSIIRQSKSRSESRQMELIMKNPNLDLGKKKRN